MNPELKTFLTLKYGIILEQGIRGKLVTKHNIPLWFFLGNGFPRCQEFALPKDDNGFDHEEDFFKRLHAYDDETRR